jgi:16S rRNA processing protein RimM
VSASTLEVGRIVKAHGLAGEVVVALITNRTERMEPGSRLHAGTRPLEVLRSRPFSATGEGRWIVAFRGVEDRGAAEALQGVILSADPIEDRTVMWVHELIGAEVVDLAGTRYGVVDAVEANPASDLLVLSNGLLIPLTFVVQQGQGQITVDPPVGLTHEIGQTDLTHEIGQTDLTHEIGQTDLTHEN